MEVHSTRLAELAKACGAALLSSFRCLTPKARITTTLFVERSTKTAAEDARTQTRIAEQNLRIATSRQFAALSSTERNKRLDRSLLLAVEALRQENTFEARDCLYKAIQDRPRIESFMHQKASNVVGVAFSSDGKTIAARFRFLATSRPVVVLWDLVTRNQLTKNPLGVEGYDINSVVFSPDGKMLAFGYGDDRTSEGGVELWDVTTRTPGYKGLVLPMPEGEVKEAAFSPDGNRLAARYSVRGGVGGGEVLWDVASRDKRPKARFPIPENGEGGLAFGSDGNVLAAGCGFPGRGGVRLWDMAGPGLTAKVPLPVPNLPLHVVAIAFSRYGSILAAGYVYETSSGVTLWNWNLLDGSVLAKDPIKTFPAPQDMEARLLDRSVLAKDPIPAPGDVFQTLAFASDGKTLAAGYKGAGGGGSVTLWDVANRKPLADSPFFVREGEVLSIAFSHTAGRDLPGIELPHLCDMIRACSHSCRCLYTGEENRHGRVHRVL